MSVECDFSDKVALITGTSSGIGEAIATHLSKLGASVVITGRNTDSVKRVAEACHLISPNKKKPLEVIADLTNDEHIKNLVNSAVEHYGKIDILVNNANISELTNMSEDLSPMMASYERIMQTNLRSIVYLTHIAVPYLEITKGNIVNVSSAVAVKPLADRFVHCMAKSALDMFTRSLSVELGPKVVRVNCVNYGAVVNMKSTPAIKKEQIDKHLRLLARGSPLGLIGEPMDVSNSVAFLASNSAAFVTGVTLFCDGGLTL